MSAIISVIRDELVVQPGIAEREAHLLEHVENQRQLFVGVRLAGQPFVEDRHADERFAVQDRDRHLRAQQLEFLDDLPACCASGLVARRMRPCRCR